MFDVAAAVLYAINDISFQDVSKAYNTFFTLCISKGVFFKLFHKCGTKSVCTHEFFKYIYPILGAVNDPFANLCRGVNLSILSHSGRVLYMMCRVINGSGIYMAPNHYPNQGRRIFNQNLQ